MDDLRNFHIEHDAQAGIVTAWCDMPGKPVNVLDESLLRELHALVEGWQHDRTLKGIVIRSKKPGCFLAGADLTQLEQLTTTAEVGLVIEAGQQLFDLISQLPIPTVAVIEGTCLGGGLELALACRYRIACDDVSTKLGLPETQLGLIPGWGGTQRLPRLIGVSAALPMILEARQLAGSKAQKRGLVDAVFPKDKLEAGIQSFLADRIAGKPVKRPKTGLVAWLCDRTGFGQRFVLNTARKLVTRKFSHYPALPAAVTAIESGLQHGQERGLRTEREQFCDVVFSPASKNLRRIFFLRERARKPATWVADASITPAAVKTVAVIGAGTMGAAIAQAAAISGFRVILKDLEQRYVDAGMQKIDKLFKDAVKAGAISKEEGAIRRNSIIGTTHWDGLSIADFAIEAVVERMAVKQEVFRELDRILRPDAIIASNTSALSISECAAVTQRPGAVAGLHFFNPVHKMPLVEIVRTAGSDERTIATLVSFVRSLGKVPLVVAERPGFLVNRVLSPYFDEAVRLVCEGANVDDVDRAAVRFGMPMGPLELLDTVGIDVAADVAGTLASFSPEASPTPARLQEMCQARLLGKKAGMGFYRYKNGQKQKPLPTEHPSKPSHLEPLHLGSDELTGLQQRLVFKLINESAQCLAEQIVREPWMIDLGLVMGTGYAPFRGGPMQTMEDWGIQNCRAALDKLSERCGKRFTPCELIKELSESGKTTIGTKRSELVSST